MSSLPRHAASYLLFLSFLLFPRCSLAICDSLCVNCPIAVPLGNCTFDTGEAFGIMVDVGTPSQRLCLTPSTVTNTTFVSTDSLCAMSDPNMTRLQCENIRGGLFQANRSETFVSASLQEYNSSRSDPAWELFNPGGIRKVGYDILHLAEGATLYGFPLGLNDVGNRSNLAMLGLGINSTFLQTAQNQKKAPSTLWSLDAGSQSLARPRNGEAVVGGYNKKRVAGDFTWSPITMAGDRPCPLRTTIKELQIIFPNGTALNLMTTAEKVQACIEPYDNLFRLTPSMLRHWKSVTGFRQEYMDQQIEANRHNLSFTEVGLLYEQHQAIDWTLKVTLEAEEGKEYAAILPQYELLQPLRGWNRAGQRETVPGVVNMAVFNEPTGGEGEIPTLGKAFLSVVSSHLHCTHSTALTKIW